MQKITNAHEIERQITTGFMINYKNRDIVIKANSKEDAKQWVYCINATLFGNVDKYFEQQYKTQNASCDIRKSRQSILNMQIDSDEENDSSI